MHTWAQATASSLLGTRLLALVGRTSPRTALNISAGAKGIPYPKLS